MVLLRLQGQAIESQHDFKTEIRSLERDQSHQFTRPRQLLAHGTSDDPGLLNLFAFTTPASKAELSRPQQGLLISGSL